MGPNALALDLARHLKAAFDIATDEYTLAYAIQAWDEEQDGDEPA